MFDQTSVDGLLGRQEDMWGRGKHVLVEDLLADRPEVAADSSAVLDLICNERRLRAELPDEEFEFQRQEYRRRFPHLGDEIDRQFNCEQALLAADFDGFKGAGSQPPATPASDPLANPDYRNFQLLARGGFGVVYRANDVLLQRPVAIKVTRPDAGIPAAGIRSLHREAVRAAKLRHPNIVEIYRVGTCNGLPYFVMPLVAAGHLGALANEYRHRYQDIARLMTAVVAAVQYAHSFGVLHCDLKPANVLIEHDGRPVLTDFGLAVALAEPACGTDPRSPTATAAPPPSLSAFLGTGGTPAYMAPEQRSGRRTDLTFLTDVYGLGAVLFHLLTGEPPGDGTDRMVSPSPRSRDGRVPRDLDAICRKCLAPSPTDRYPSAEAMGEELKRYLEDRPVVARQWNGAIGGVYRAWKWRNRNRWLAWFFAAVAVGTAAGVTLQAIHSWRFARQTDELATASAAAADSLFDLGHLAAARGSKHQAVDSYRRALDSFDRLAAQYPADPLYRLKLARTRNNLATLFGDLGQPGEAETLFRKALTDLAALDRRPVPPAGVSAEEANVHANLGNLYLRTDHPADAAAAHARAEKVRNEIAATNPGDLEARFAVAKSHVDFGNMYRDRAGRAADATDRYRKAATELDALIDGGFAPRELFDRRLQVTTNLALLAVDHGRPDEADGHYQSAVARWERLLVADPHNTQYRRMYATALSNRGAWHLDIGRLEDGLRALAQAEREYLRAMGGEEVGVTTRGHYGICKANLALAHFRISEREAARATAVAVPEREAVFEAVMKARQDARAAGEEAVRILQEWATAEPEAADPLIFLASACTDLGNVAFADGRVAEARSRYAEAMGTLDRIPRPNVKARLLMLTVLNDVGRACLDSTPADVFEFLGLAAGSAVAGPAGPAALVVGQLQGGAIDAAERYFDRGVRDGSILATENPTHTGIPSRLMGLHDGLGLADLRRFDALPHKDQTGDVGRLLLRRMVDHFTDAIRCGEDASRAGNRETDLARILCDTYARRATFRERLGDLTGALADWTVVAGRIDGKQPIHVLFAIARASLLAKTGDHARAAEALAKLGGGIARHPDGPFNSACAYAQAYKAIDRDKTVSPGERQRLTEDYRRRTVAALHLAKSRGFFQSEDMRWALESDDDLAPIRGTAEFRAFVESLPPLPAPRDKK